MDIYFSINPLPLSLMFAVGHISVAYLLTRGLKRAGSPSMSIPLVMAFSLLPDLDLLIPGVGHMGPTHSLAFAIARAVIMAV